MVPIIAKEVVEKKKWIGEDEMTDILAVAQSVPGAIAINTSVLVGYKVARVKGSVAAILGTVLPSFFVILTIAVFFRKFGELPVVKSVFAGIRAAIVALIFTAAFRISRSAVRDRIGLVIAAVAIVLVILGVHGVLLIIGGALSGLAIYLLYPRKAAQVLGKAGNGNGNGNS